MQLKDWMEIYEEILEDFGFSKEEDERAAEIMHELGKGKLLDSSVLDFLKGRKVAVIGGAYGGEKIEEDVILTAGKAVKLVDTSAYTPSIHVTDMEEDDEILLDLERKGCILVLHAHGDNIDRIKSVIPKVERFIGTTQSKPFDRIYNFGGFTDGDRAVLLAKHFGAKVRLYGFDFERADSEIKRKKLKWARKILLTFARDALADAP